MGEKLPKRVFHRTTVCCRREFGARLRPVPAGRTVTIGTASPVSASATGSVLARHADLSATVVLAEIAKELVRTVLADRLMKTISLLAISVSHLEEHYDVRLEDFPLGLEVEAAART